MSRMDDLVGKSHKTLTFRELPTSHQLAIAHYMAIDGEAWDVLFEDTASDLEDVKTTLASSLNEYVRVYGDSVWQVANLPVERIKRAVMADPEIASSFSCWHDYAVWYCGAGDVPEYGPTHRWPVILSDDDEETLRDGWHRLHSYIRAGHADIPAVF